MHSIIWQTLKIKTVTLYNVFRGNHVYADEYASFFNETKTFFEFLYWRFLEIKFKIETRKERLYTILMSYQFTKKYLTHMMLWCQDFWK